MNYSQEIHNIVPAWISWFLPQGAAFTSHKHNPYSKHLNLFTHALLKHWTEQRGKESCDQITLDNRSLVISSAYWHAVSFSVLWGWWDPTFSADMIQIEIILLKAW